MKSDRSYPVGYVVCVPYIGNGGYIYVPILILADFKFNAFFLNHLIYGQFL